MCLEDKQMNWLFVMIAKFLAGVVVNYVTSDTMKRDLINLKERTFDIEANEGLPGQWSPYLRPMTQTFYESYLVMLKHTAMYDRECAPV